MRQKTYTVDEIRHALENVAENTLDCYVTSLGTDFDKNDMYQYSKGGLVPILYLLDKLCGVDREESYKYICELNGLKEFSEMDIPEMLEAFMGEINE